MNSSREEWSINIKDTVWSTKCIIDTFVNYRHITCQLFIKTQVSQSAEQIKNKTKTNLWSCVGCGCLWWFHFPAETTVMHEFRVILDWKQINLHWNICLKNFLNLSTNMWSLFCLFSLINFGTCQDKRQLYQDKLSISIGFLETQMTDRHRVKLSKLPSSYPHFCFIKDVIFWLVRK